MASAAELDAKLSVLLSEVERKRIHDLIKRQYDASVEWDRVIPLKSDEITNFNSITIPEKSEIVEALKKVAILKLNGGLGTTMGLSGPKSAIVVKEKKSFLELTFDQIRVLNKTYGVSVPLVLMNSFNTEVETKKFVEKASDIEVLCFNQHQFPRLDQATLLPLAESKDAPGKFWYPPGHGDLYDSLLTSGTLDILRKRGIEVIFISNVDNLGACLEPKLLVHLLKSSADVMIENTAKTQADIKGGTIIRYRTGSSPSETMFKDLETAQVPKEYLGEFKSIRKFSLFNTGNLWVRLPFIEDALKKETLQLDVIRNPKVLDGRPILQLETAAGSIVSCSPNVEVIDVPRIRFIPTKTSADLALIMSSFYVWDAETGRLLINPQRNFHNIPVMSLGPCIAKMPDFVSHMPSVPAMDQLESLTVVGDVRFGEGIVLRGNVVIVADEGKTLFIPSGSVIDNATVTGSLRIVPR